MLSAQRAEDIPEINKARAEYARASAQAAALDIDLLKNAGERKRLLAKHEMECKARDAARAAIERLEDQDDVRPPLKIVENGHQIGALDE